MGRTDQTVVESTNKEVPDSPSLSSKEGGFIQDRSKDQALQFLATSQASDYDIAGVDLKRLRRRIDWRILPVMFCCYTMQFLDKVVLNYGAVMGLNADLKLKGNDFSNANTFTFVAILIAEIPTGFLLNKLPAGKFLGACVVFWGISTASVAATHNYTGLLVSRIFLGIFEASIGPCLMIISSQWYTKREQPLRFAFWYCGLGCGQIVGALTSFGFQHVKNPAFAGWRIMFITLGMVTAVIGLATYFIIPDTPMTAKWMNDAEKSALLQHVSVNKTGVANKQFKLSQVWELLLDPQMYLLTLMLLLLSTTAGVTTTYSATLLRNIGFNPKQAAVLNAPSGVISITSTIIGGIGVRYGRYRWPWILICASPAIIGAAIMSFVRTKGGVLAGIWLVNFTPATMPIIWSWVAANNAGHTKRPLAMALIAGAFGVGNIIGPQTFQARDAPQYIPAKITSLATLSAGALCSLLLLAYYKFVNARRDRKFGRPEESGPATDAEKWSNLTDKENTTFRYVY